MLFKRVDQDGNGTITREDFPQIFKARNITFGEAEIDRWLRVMDKDKSGSLTYTEALKVIKKIVR